MSGSFIRKLGVLLPLAVGVAMAQGERKVDPKLLGVLQWRSIGPAMFSGRVSDVAGIPGNPSILVYAHSSGGVFRSTNGGTTFDSIFNDGNTLSAGAVAISPDNPEVIYVGTGEGCVRNSISFGDGIYKTTDAGRTWKHLGLKDTERFSQIVIDPKRPQIVFAAAMGHAFGPNEERGIFRSTDGGATWKKVLYVNNTTGASDVAIDPQNPQIVYAGMYDYMRKPWHFRSGGPGSGLYRSADGGETWTRLTDPALKNGLPGARLLGRIGVSVAAANPNVVYALIEAQEPGTLWRSNDRGLHWNMVHAERSINNRPFYYTHIFADPVDENRVYSLSGSFHVSTDGGKTFGGNPGASMFGDHHALWIDPTNPSRLLAGTDGGFFVSQDRGRRWDFFNNVPLAQAYHVGIDMADPYNVMGGFQDHEIWRGPNERWNQVGVREGDWRRLRYMADGMYTVADPRDPNIVYFNGHFGDITRIDMRNSEERYIQPYPLGPNGRGADGELYRFNWNSPIHMSPTNPDVIYYGGNVLFKTTDSGSTWSIISPDLTTNDKEKQKLSGGEISLDNTRAEFHCTIVAISESPRDSKVIWVGTDDGNVQITRDGGKTWTNVVRNVRGAPANGWVPAIHTSNRDPGTAYVAIDNHWLNDFAPHAFVTHDYGNTWTRISAGLNGYVHIVMEDPKEPELLYAGTELGVFASFDRGKTWTDLRMGLPRLPVVDIKVHPRDNDLIIATHARGFYILDDATALQRMAHALTSKVSLFKPMRATRYQPASDTSTLGNRVWVARNKPYGASVSYYLAEGAAGNVDLAILNAKGETVRTLAATGNPGINRVIWNLREPGCPVAAPAGRGGGRGRRGEGPRVLPDEYRVRLTAGGQSFEQPFEVRMDPRIQASREDLDVYYREVKRLDRMECSANQALAEIRSLGPRNELAEIASAIQVNIRSRLNWLVLQVGQYSGRPTAAQIEWIGKLEAQLDGLLSKYREIAKRIQ